MLCKKQVSYHRQGFLIYTGVRDLEKKSVYYLSYPTTMPPVARPAQPIDVSSTLQRANNVPVGRERTGRPTAHARRLPSDSRRTCPTARIDPPLRIIRPDWPHTVGASGADAPPERRRRTTGPRGRRLAPGELSAGRRPAGRLPFGPAPWRVNLKTNIRRATDHRPATGPGPWPGTQSTTV